MSVAIVGAGAVSGHGFEWRGLGAAVAGGASYRSASKLLGESFPGTVSCELDALPDPADGAERMARRRMSRGAMLATLATRGAVGDAGWTDECADVGFYLGVGASGGTVDQLEAILAASIVDGRLPDDRFGDAGLRACNPLYVFQLMNNFTLCHSAILAGTRGPNGAFFSRGGGTVAALAEAVAAIEGGECDRCLAGGADSAIYPVTWSELIAGGFAGDGAVPAEGAAVIALASEAHDAVAFVESCHHHAVRGRALAPLIGDTSEHDLIVVAPWGPPMRMQLQAWLYGTRSTARVVDVTASLGEALAATPALAWTAALDLLRTDEHRSAIVITAGTDGDLGVVRLRAAA